MSWSCLTRMSRVHPVFHVSKLKPYRDGSSAFPDRQQLPVRPGPEVLPDTGEEAWEVERVVGDACAWSCAVPGPVERLSRLGEDMGASEPTTI